MKTVEYRRYKAELKKLVKHGEWLYGIISEILKPEFQYELKPGPRFTHEYQKWYSNSLEYMNRVFPSRAGEFETLYQGNPKRKDVTEHNFAVRDWLIGKNVFRRWSQKEIDHDQAETAVHLIQLQCEILKSSILAFDKGAFLTQNPDRRPENNNTVKTSG